MIERMITDYNGERSTVTMPSQCHVIRVVASWVVLLNAEFSFIIIESALEPVRGSITGAIKFDSVLITMVELESECKQVSAHYTVML